VAGSHIALALAIEKELEVAKGRKLPLNVDGTIAAVISDMGFTWRLGKAFFVMGRCGGLVAQVWEEMTREKPMRRMYPTAHDYDGPDERDLPTGE
jgi:citrate synthase